MVHILRVALSYNSRRVERVEIDLLCVLNNITKREKLDRYVGGPKPTDPTHGTLGIKGFEFI